jgi:capsule synthesis protein PGA_cap
VLAAIIATACTHTAAAPAASASRDPGAPRLWIAGDVFLGTGGHGALAGIAAIVGGAPGVVNLEGPVGGDGAAGVLREADRGAAAGVAATPGSGDRGGLRLLQVPAALAELAQAGIAVAGIANNHAHDAGPGGAAATIRALTAVGVQPAGGPAGPATLVLGGLRVLITAHDLEHGVPPSLRDDLAAARRRGDVLVATFHVTGPASYLPRPELVDAVAIALAAGATVIAAHGTHELARVERRGRAVIAWGLGNLAFACACTDEDSGAVLDVTLDRDGAAAASIIPIDASLLSGTTRPAADPALTFELLGALGSSHLDRHGDRAAF